MAEFENWIENYIIEKENGFPAKNLILKNKTETDKITVVSFASLDDHQGTRYNIEYIDGTLSFPLLTAMMNYFEINLCPNYNFWNEASFNKLLKWKFYVRIHDKYYHLAIALDYTTFELESKGTPYSDMKWSIDPVKRGVHHRQISTTGKHMWYDGYSIPNPYDDDDDD